MVEVRKSTRIKVEPGLKRRFSDALEADTPPAKPAKAAKTTVRSTPKPAPKTSPVAEPVPLILPNKLTDTTLLPVLPSPQPDDLPDAEWQDLSSSGVFAASLSRARTTIAKGAFFERFWTKPVATKKQKDMTEEEKAALKAAKGPTQSKVGTVKMISEPLTFEVTLFMIKDLDQRQRLGQLPVDRQHLIYGGPGRTQNPTYNSATYRPPVQQQGVQHVTTGAGARPPAPITPTPSVQHQQVYAPPPMARPSPQSTPSHQHSPQVNRAPPTTHPPPQTHASPATHAPPVAQTAPKPAPTPTPTPTAAPATNTTLLSQPKAATSAQAPDPVIHALAQRASANPELKAVMKIVATGRASQNQLQYFQKHIDELTELVRQRQEQEAKTKAAQQATAGAARPSPAAVSAGTSRPTPPATPALAPPIKQETKSAAAPSPAPTQTPRPPPSSTAAPATPQAQSTPTQQPAEHQPTHRPPQPLSTPAQPTSTVAPQQQHRAIPSPAPPAQPLAPVHTPSQAQVHRLYQPPQAPPSTSQHHHQTTPASQQQYYHAHPAPISTQQLYTPPPAPTPRPRMVTTATPQHILIAFAENANERFLFPKNCVMEWNSTLTEVICSFVVVKKVPSSSSSAPAMKKDGEAEKEGKEMWVPVTLTFRGDAPTLSVLGRVAEPLETARERMEDAMCRGERGEDGFLALRLPVEARAVD